MAITPAAGFVNYTEAIIMALIGGGCCYLVINYIKVKLNYNDALDAFGIHGIGGIVGALLTEFSNPKTQILPLKTAYLQEVIGRQLVANS